MKNAIILTAGLGLAVMWGTAEVRTHRLQATLDTPVYAEGTYMQIAIDYGISEACSLKAANERMPDLPQ